MHVPWEHLFYSKEGCGGPDKKGVWLALQPCTCFPASGLGADWEVLIPALLAQPGSGGSPHLTSVYLEASARCQPPSRAPGAPTGSISIIPMCVFMWGSCV